MMEDEHSLGGINGWIQSEGRVQIDPVEVDTTGVGPVVSSGNAVGVQYRNQLEHVLPSKLDSPRVIRPEYEIQKAIEYKAARRFARMHTATHKVDLKRNKKKFPATS